MNEKHLKKQIPETEKVMCMTLDVIVLCAHVYRTDHHNDDRFWSEQNEQNVAKNNRFSLTSNHKEDNRQVKDFKGLVRDIYPL